MDDKQIEQPTPEANVMPPEPSAKTDSSAAQDAKIVSDQTNEAKCKRHSKHAENRVKNKKKKSKTHRKKDISSSESSTDATDTLSDDSDSSSDDDDDDDKRISKTRKRHGRRKRAKAKTRSRRSRHDSSSDDSASDTASDDSASSSVSIDGVRSRRRKLRNAKAKKHKNDSEDSDDDDAGESSDHEDTQLELAQLKQRLAVYEGLGGGSNATIRDRGNIFGGRAAQHKSLFPDDPLSWENARVKLKAKSKSKQKKKTKAKRATTLEYKRVDQLWDNSIHNYKLTESVEDQEDEFDQYVFNVRRKFDWENKYKHTVVDIKSKILREALQEVLKDVKGISLVEDQPSIDPNMLFLYLEELRNHVKKTLKAKLKSEKKRKAKKRIQLMIAQCKVLISYLDQDYAETKKTLYPMLEAGHITFDLLWALFKPNTIAYTTTYGSVENPRAFKVDYATKQSSLMRGDWYCIEGRYLEYDGKSFGLGDFEVDIEAFKGPRKVTSLASYPIQYHKDAEGLKSQLIARGKRFVTLEGMNYRFHKGLAFMKKKRSVAKVNINGRVMVDPAIFRRINANYPISVIKPKDPDEELYGLDDDSDCSVCCGGNDSDDDQAEGGGDDHLSRETTKYKLVYDKEKKPHLVEVPVDAEGQEIHTQNIDKLPTDGKAQREFSEEELLIASPVVLGFAFSEKLWLEFSLSGITEIEWNDGAFESLVLPENQKSIARALVESHKFHAAKTIDDVVQGKGRGLVAVLHGPPGTGKTLTAEGIAELLRCPLYMVSAGELGTDPRTLEAELQKILDIAHSWGAVLLLDEADVFLEKREVHDIHRNALVSIFLRLLEYFQGILFLTTNRVDTFDEAFASRCHISFSYEPLDQQSRLAVWKNFLGLVQQNEAKLAASEVASTATTLTDGDTDAPSTKDAGTSITPAQLTELSRIELNGREIKNVTKIAQLLARDRGTNLKYEHIRAVLDGTRKLHDMNRAADSVRGAIYM